MSNKVKSKFAGLLRGLLRRMDEREAPAAEASPSQPVPAAAPTPARTKGPTMPSASRSMFSQPTPAIVQPSNSSDLELPLQAVFAALPMDLRSKIMKAVPDGATLSLAVEKVLPQLASGSVKITFGELRQAAAGFFISGGEHDNRPVVLPLNEILCRLNPALLARRTVRRQIEVSDEISGPFGPRGQGAVISSITKPTPPPPTATPAPYRMVTPESPAKNGSPPPPVAPPPPPFVPRPTTPKAKKVNGTASKSESSPIPMVAPIPMTPPPKAPEPPPEPEAVMAPLSSLSEKWPDALKSEIVQLNLSNAQVFLPVNMIETALKRGRVAFLWRNLREWIKPAPTEASFHDSIELELPLKVIAPLFMARQKAATKAHQKVEVTEEIPNLFFGTQTKSPQPAAPSAKPHKPAKSAVPAVPVKPTIPQSSPIPFPGAPTNLASAAPTAKSADTNFFEKPEVNYMTDTEFRRRSPGVSVLSPGVAPKDMVERATAFGGVAGAVVALPDGLKVASKIPSGLNADTLAAFLPQIFERVSQTTKELRMGVLNNVSFTVGNIPWKIFRVNAVYFAAFGRAGESLPTGQLAALAAELDSRKQ